MFGQLFDTRKIIDRNETIRRRIRLDDGSLQHDGYNIGISLIPKLFGDIITTYRILECQIESIGAINSKCIHFTTCDEHSRSQHCFAFLFAIACAHFVTVRTRAEHVDVDVLLECVDVHFASTRRMTMTHEPRDRLCLVSQQLIRQSNAHIVIRQWMFESNCVTVWR